MAEPQEVRYSTANVAQSEEAQSFSWEMPIPVNNFWNSISFCTSRGFLDNFSADEIKQLPIDADSTASTEDKLRLLQRLLEEKLSAEEARRSPHSLYDADYAKWYGLWGGIYTLQADLGLPQAEQTARMLADRRPDESNLSPLHLLAGHLVDTGKHAEGEALERRVCAWMDGHERLGRDSPQAINARRIIAKALWMQGESRRAEAEALLLEIRAIVEGMGAGRFGVYQEEERKLTREMVASLGE